MELLDRNTPTPPEGAAMFSVTVPAEELPPVTVDGFNETADTPTLGGAGPHWPPAHASPKSQPHMIVPPQPSGRFPHGPPCTVPPLASRQVRGVQPPVTVSRVVTGAWPGAPELELIVTVVVRGTEFAAWIVSAPPP